MDIHTWLLLLLLYYSIYVESMDAYDVEQRLIVININVGFWLCLME